MNCQNCPFSEDRNYGRERLYCNHLDEVVRTHHKPTIDCMSALAKVATMPEALQTKIA